MDREARLTSAMCLPGVGRRSELMLLGRTLAQLYGAERGRCADAFAAGFAGETAAYERLLTHRGGERRWCRCRSSRVRLAG